MAEKVNYTGHFVDDQKELLRQHPPKLEGEGVKIYAHHVTKEYRPKKGIEDVEVGKKRVLYAIGYVATPEVHALLVHDPDGGHLSVNENPHITIATASGISPVVSNEAIEQAKLEGTIMLIEPPIAIPTTEGYFNGKKVVTEL